MTVDELAAMFHENSKGHGFWDGVDDVAKVIPEKIALIHSELSEALEAYRSGDMKFRTEGPDDKPEGFGAELADVLIRTSELYEAWRRQVNGMPMEDILRRKHAYNIARPYRHGGKAC